MFDSAVLSRAAVAVGVKETEVREFPLPEIPTEAGLLRVASTGMCGADWPMYLDAKPGPRILGHEIVGTIEKLGDVARARWQVNEGDLVALEEYLPCGNCNFCRSGEFRSCLQTDFWLPGTFRYGSTSIDVMPSLWGGYSQFLYLHPRSVLHRVPKGIPTRIAAMALPLGNGFQWACLDGHAGPGQTVVIQGPGQQGLGCVIAAKSAGAEKIILTGLARDARRFEVAKTLGADHVIAVDQEDLEGAVTRITGGDMADLVIDASAGSSEIINTSLRLVHKHSTVLFAAPKGVDVPSFDIDRAIRLQLTMKGVRGHSFHAVEMGLRTMAAGKIPLEALSTHEVALGDVDEALRMLGGEFGDPIHMTVAPWK